MGIARTKRRPSSKMVSKRDSKGPIAQLRDSAQRGELVAVIGSGVSMALTNDTIPALSWAGLIRNGFTFGVKTAKIARAQAKNWAAQLGSRDMDDLLCAAEFMGRKLESPHGNLYARWLQGVFQRIQPLNKKMQNALAAIHKAGVPLCTLNYDHLIENVTKASAVNLSEHGKVLAWLRRETAGILHLHGSWDAPATCILGVRDYETTLTDEVRDLFQHHLAAFRHLLFIGCGDTLSDPNFSALITWLRERVKAASPLHYALVTNGDVAARHADPIWRGFVEPVGYGAAHADLPAFLLKHFTTAKAARTKNRGGLRKAPTSTSEHARLVAAYRAFLLRDCGQMAIEGVRADMEIGQRKFDIEKLFVPLKVLPCLPDIPQTDPKREQKLLRRKEKQQKPRPFGSVFAKTKRLALLALPGGGKTLLLKRLAVAYADPSRRALSGDALPDLDVMPVLIRCREWREHINKPVLTILQKLPDITGDARLNGLTAALLPLFKKGRVLLLVDGLDEIHNDAHRSIFVEHLADFLEEYKLTRLVVTSREAGFGLVAPCIARFCQRFRVAQLQEDAISALCAHWQSLMGGDSPEMREEGQQLAQQLLRNPSLCRLAENPLLLTMLLVVKHGAGRLPPDRVSLYGRAVEVLLDTWNIKGHDPLNPKEAVPQLAYVAFEMMRAGKQTATEDDLLRLLDDARQNVPQIRRYAKDTPHEFLKRVELRSSLLIEAGYQVNGGRTVPFYQFRHLTFQEYLAAVAAAEGHYRQYDRNASVLTPLKEYLTVEEWKEVIPMAAVLARKPAEPLMAALVEQGKQLRAGAEKDEDALPRKYSVPPAIARLLQCLVEETEAAPETLTAALQLAVFFAHGCRQKDVDWAALSRGPYGTELLHQAWLLYAPMQWTVESDIVETYGWLAARQHPWAYWTSGVLEQLLGSKSAEDVSRRLLTWPHFLRLPVEEDLPGMDWDILTQLVSDIERHLFAEDLATRFAAVYAFAHYSHGDILCHYTMRQPSPHVLSELLALRLHSTFAPLAMWSAVALSAEIAVPRGAWVPYLTEAEKQHIRDGFDHVSYLSEYCAVGDLIAAFHAKGVWPDDELAHRLAKTRDSHVVRGTQRGEVCINAMLEELGEAGRKYLKRQRSRRKEPQ